MGSAQSKETDLLIDGRVGLLNTHQLETKKHIDHCCVSLTRLQVAFTALFTTKKCFAEVAK